MSFRYKSAWVSLVSMVLVYGWYFGGVIAAGHNGFGTGGTMVGLIATIVILTVLQIVGHILIAIFSPGWSGKLDEREWAFELRATNVGYYALIAGLFGMVPLIGAAGSVHSFANAVVLMVVAAECARQVVFLTQFHKAA
jgi:hypothetical protein